MTICYKPSWSHVTGSKQLVQTWESLRLQHFFDEIMSIAAVRWARHLGMWLCAFEHGNILISLGNINSWGFMECVIISVKCSPRIMIKIKRRISGIPPFLKVRKRRTSHIDRRFTNSPVMVTGVTRVFRGGGCHLLLEMTLIWPSWHIPNLWPRSLWWTWWKCLHIHVIPTITRSLITLHITTITILKCQLCPWPVHRKVRSAVPNFLNIWHSLLVVLHRWGPRPVIIWADTIRRCATGGWG